MRVMHLQEKVTERAGTRYKAGVRRDEHVYENCMALLVLAIEFDLVFDACSEKFFCFSE